MPGDNLYAYLACGRLWTPSHSTSSSQAPDPWLPTSQVNKYRIRQTFGTGNGYKHHDAHVRLVHTSHPQTLAITLTKNVRGHDARRKAGELQRVGFNTTHHTTNTTNTTNTRPPRTASSTSTAQRSASEGGRTQPPPSTTDTTTNSHKMCFVGAWTFVSLTSPLKRESGGS